MVGRVAVLNWNQCGHYVTLVTESDELSEVQWSLVKFEIHSNGVVLWVTVELEEMAQLLVIVFDDLFDIVLFEEILDFLGLLLM